jgi:hypothetical protein
MKHLSIEQLKEKSYLNEEVESIKTVISKNDIKRSHSVIKN